MREIIMIDIGVTLTLLLIGYISGKILERRHFRRLISLEAAYLREITVTNLRNKPLAGEVEKAFLCMGSVVVASDYFKTFVASLKKLIGGRIRSFEKMVERARRESLIRMIENAREKGVDEILNVRFETSTTARGAHKKGVPCVEVLAYGTAVKYKK